MESPTSGRIVASEEGLAELDVAWKGTFILRKGGCVTMPNAGTSAAILSQESPAMKGGDGRRLILLGERGGGREGRREA